MPYLSADMMKVYNALFDQAEKAVANNPQLLTRVKIARLPIMYATIQIGRNEVDTLRSMVRAHTRGGQGLRKTGDEGARRSVRQRMQGGWSNSSARENHSTRRLPGVVRQSLHKNGGDAKFQVVGEDNHFRHAP